MDSQGRPTTPDAAVPPPQENAPTPGPKIVIDLEFKLQTSQLVIRSAAATVMLQGVLIDALTKGVVDQLHNDPTLPMAPDGVARVVVTYDMAEDRHEIQAQAPRVVVKGIIQNALGELAAYQFTQRVQKRLAALENGVHELKQMGAAPKIILPGR